MGRKPKPMTLVEHLERRKAQLNPPSDTKLGALFGVSQSAANRWLRGDTAPDIEKAPVLARELGLTVDETKLLIVGAGTQARLGPAARLDALEARLNKVEEDLARLVLRRGGTR